MENAGTPDFTHHLIGLRPTVSAYARELRLRKPTEYSEEQVNYAKHSFERNH